MRDGNGGKLTADNAPATGSAITGEGTTKRRALVIDDESTIRAALRRFFTRRGWAVDDAEDGVAGLAMLRASGDVYTAVISDLRMPGLSGIELHDHLVTERPELLDRLILSTGDVASHDAAEFVARTRCLVLQKPFELSALAEAVDRLSAPSARRGTDPTA